MMTELEFVRERAGTNNWVVARRSARIVGHYGADVFCFSPQAYAKVRDDYEAYVEAETVRAIAEQGLPLVEALLIAYRAGKAR